MTKLIVHYDDNSDVILESQTAPPPPTSDNIPEEINPESLPEGFVWKIGDNFEVAVVKHDVYYSDRPTLINETNMLHPLRPVEPETSLSFTNRVMGFFLSLIGWRVYPTGKIIMNIGNGGIYSWMLWIIDLIGGRNAEKFVSKGDGFCDTSPEDALPDGSTEIKYMAAKTGGAPVKIVESIYQSGTWYDVIECFDYRNPPVKQSDGTWMVENKIYHPDTNPEMFTVRNNRKLIDSQNHPELMTWQVLEAYGANDAGITGGKGFERWPTICDTKAALSRSLLYRYVSPGERVIVYKNSLVVDGNLVSPSGEGLTITIGSYLYYRSTIYVQDADTGKMYLASTMLQRANPETREPGTAYDYRCFVARITKPLEPFMGRAGYSEPDCRWLRTYDGYVLV